MARLLDALSMNTRNKGVVYLAEGCYKCFTRIKCVMTIKTINNTDFNLSYATDKDYETICQRTMKYEAKYLIIIIYSM